MMVKKGKANKVPLKPSDQHLVDEANQKLKTALSMKQNAKTNEEKLQATKAESEAREFIKIVSIHSFINVI
jgi:hypothetical protein